MRDDNGGSAVGGAVKGLLHQVLTMAVERRGGFLQCKSLYKGERFRPVTC